MKTIQNTHLLKDFKTIQNAHLVFSPTILIFCEKSFKTTYFLRFLYGFADGQLHIAM
jgi:hypothetical protein